MLPDRVVDHLSANWHLVVVNEAQDIPEETVDTLRCCCDRNGSVLLVIHDSNQRLERKNSEIPAQFARVTFNKVLRSTSQIGELSSRFYISNDSSPRNRWDPRDFQSRTFRSTTGTIYLPRWQTSFSALLMNRGFRFATSSCSLDIRAGSSCGRAAGHSGE